LLKKIKKIYNAITTAILAGVLVLLLLLVGVRLIGLKPYAVLSGSMEPKYHVGSIIYVKEADPAELKVGDPLTFTKSGATVTHEIIYIIGSNDPEKILFETQGLTNNVSDGYIPVSSIIGKPVFTIPYLGYVSVFFQTPIGLFGAICFIIMTLMISLTLELLADKSKKAEKSQKPSVLHGEEDDPASDPEDNTLTTHINKEEKQ